MEDIEETAICWFNSANMAAVMSFDTSTGSFSSPFCAFFIYPKQ
jgi:hypothetical protein